MGLDFRLLGRVRTVLEAIDQLGPATEDVLAINDQRELLVAQGAAPYSEIVRTGRAWEVHTVAAIAAVVARPTTAVMLAIYNNEPDDGKVIVLDRVWALNEVSTAVASQATLLGCLGQVREAAPVDAALPINPLNGMGGAGGGSRMRSILNATALPATTGLAANWRVLPGQTGGQKPGAAATPGYFVGAQIDGRIILPPGRYFGIHVMANVIGETFTCGIEAHEKNIKIG